LVVFFVVGGGIDWTVIGIFFSMYGGRIKQGGENEQASGG